MSIKADRWIRRMAAQGMIEPYSEGQVRTAADGHRIVSYGTSSYGYDVRCAEEFKIFTNINSTIVDPKAFDEKSFVDFKGPVCIIPPNSFALARTVEFFRIPRSVLTVCLGKCVTADTRLVDADTGAYLPITEMRWGRSTLAWNGNVLERARISALIPQGRREVFELRTRAGLKIRATANHPFLTPARWAALGELKSGDQIGVAGHIAVFGKRSIPDWEATLLGRLLSAEEGPAPGNRGAFAEGHPPRQRLPEDSPEASGIQAWLACPDVNAALAGRWVPQRVFEAPEASVRLFLKSLMSIGGAIKRIAGGRVTIEYRSPSWRLIEDIHHLLLRFGIASGIREGSAATGARDCRLEITDGQQILRFAHRVGFLAGSIAQQDLESEVSPLLTASLRRREADAALGLAAVQSAGRPRAPAARQSGPSGYDGARDLGPAEEAPAPGPVWDTVESIEPAGVAEVFDISVPRLHNFVANDLIVHNSTYARCGIIVNVTPLEPEWEGHVTLEFSNTTPLPAKIYANEGVAQMLFFESDEVCETSYKDRGGKYQGQRGVTLPKT